MKKLVISESVDTVVEKLLAGIDAVNMRVVAHINGQANARKLGKEVPADQILEVFRPDFAIRVWQASKPAGIEIPLRIHVYEQAGATHVACRMPGETFAPYDSAELSGIGAELDVIFGDILRFVAPD
ncbi:DUF302 domain-containing protein [Acidihalobacter aeolianus]|uniref:DUF302 domain-containing protein n=1 Tax=Acidihalobacter aeolianus TaxID=2792603 RepID=A0A1D8KB97_9GAMM|nr:DUF302 domain-containing protein [Acidihalobacter aeolianus]AOV18243.1 DUF302 domain-containing protein [Acidihalobacter aeolianus]